MERIIWVIGNNRTDVIDIQRKINQGGSMKALCMLSFDALLITAKERLLENNDYEVMPSLIIMDYALDNSDARFLETIKDIKQLAGVPLFFICDNKNEKIEEECYQKGALVALGKPVSERGLVRIERAAWQYENTKQYERFLQEQATKLKTAEEIFRLNRQLEKRNEFLHKIFGRYFSDDVLEFILNQPEGNAIGGARKEVVVLNADLRGFSSIAEEMEPDAMTTMLNVYFGRMTEIIMEFHGTIIEFMGDGILAVFGVLQNGRDYRMDAMAAAVCMQNSMEQVNDFCDENGYPNLEMGIGLHCGEVFIGNVGSEKMMRYNVLGSVVNECSRIESYSVGGQILISAGMKKGIEEKIKVSSMIELAAKGIKKPLEIFALEEIQTDGTCYSLSNNGKFSLNDVSIPVTFEMVLVKDKILDKKKFTCELKIISMNEAVLYMLNKNTEIGLYDDVMITAYDDNYVLFEQVYAKVIRCEGSWLKIRFTHLNHGFKKFIKSGLIGRNYESEGCDFVNGITVKQVDKADLNALEQFGEKNVLLWENAVSEINFVFKSVTGDIRALEFMDYFLEDFGMSKGNGSVATGMVSKTMMDMVVTKSKYDNLEDYINNRVNGYFEEIDWIYAGRFDISQLPAGSVKTYKKKRRPWAFVRSTDIACEGEIFTLRSLENESGVRVCVSENVFVMIGLRGEVYDISSDKFKNTYEETDEYLDVFTRMVDFIPEVRLEKTGEYISIDDKARICYPKDGSEIFAMPLQKRTKVFYGSLEDEYFLGREGDYLAIRKDDLQDIYIIKKNIFLQTYEQV